LAAIKERSFVVMQITSSRRPGGAQTRIPVSFEQGQERQLTDSLETRATSPGVIEERVILTSSLLAEETARTSTKLNTLSVVFCP
jgi:hypothetical protein